MHRQQLVLLALRQQLDPLSLLPRIPDLLDAAGATLWTTLTPSDLVSLAKLAAKVDVEDVQTTFFTPHAYPEFLTDDEIGQIRSVVRNTFTDWTPPVRGPNSTPATCR